jgi:hypothetical protein
MGLHYASICGLQVGGWRKKKLQRTKTPWCTREFFVWCTHTHTPVLDQGKGSRDFAPWRWLRTRRAVP